MLSVDSGYAMCSKIVTKADSCWSIFHTVPIYLLSSIRFCIHNIATNLKGTLLKRNCLGDTVVYRACSNDHAVCLILLCHPSIVRPKLLKKIWNGNVLITKLSLSFQFTFPIHYLAKDLQKCIRMLPLVCWCARVYVHI